MIPTQITTATVIILITAIMTKRCSRAGLFGACAAMLSVFFIWKSAGGGDTAFDYADRLFDDSKVHRADIRLEDWDGFLENARKEEYVSCALTLDGELYENVGIRVKGNNSRRLTEKYGWQRYSLKVEFDHYMKGRTYHGLDKMSFDASFQDNSYMKNYLTYKMMAHMGVPSPLSSYVWVTVNGEPWGLFLALEEPEEAFARRNFGSDHGQLYKPDYRRLDDENADVALRYIDDDPDSYENIFRKARTDVAPEDKEALIRSLKLLSEGERLEEAADVDEVLRYFTVQVFVVNLDSYLGKTGHNYFLYVEDGRMQILPWDYNLAFATYSLGMPDPVNDAELYVNYPIDTPAAGEVMLKRPLYHMLMLQEEYYREYHRLFAYFMETYFENGVFENVVEETEELIGPYVEKDPTAFCSYEDHRLAVETLTRFCLLRARSVRGQLDGKIPSTIRGQSADSSSFVDASSIRLPDMGEIEDLKR